MISGRDLALISFAFESAQTFLAAFGKMETFCVLENDSGERSFVQSGGFYDTSDKDEFMQICRVAGAATQAHALVVVGESWKLNDVDDDERPHLEELWRQGKLGEHPKARECVSLLVECDVGIISISRAIDRSEPLWPVLVPQEDRDIEIFPYGDKDFEGRFTRMLPPREKRAGAAAQAQFFLKQMEVRLVSMDEFQAVTVRPQA